VLKDLGFEEAELARSWNGESEIPLRDHRMHLLSRDAILWRDAAEGGGREASCSSGPAAVRRADEERRARGPDQLSKQLENASGQNATRIAAALVAARRALAERNNKRKPSEPSCTLTPFNAFWITTRI